MRDEEQGDDLLGGLPRLDVGAEAAERIRALAHAELDRAARPARPLAFVRRAYRRVEPALVAAVAASYLFWAVRVVFP